MMITKDNSQGPRIKVTLNGPYFVRRKIPISENQIIADEKGVSVAWKEGKKYPEKESCAFCRCGQSKNKPYCDRSHQKNNFDGTETAGDNSFESQAQEFKGPMINLKDAPTLCAGARFCHREPGTWEATLRSDHPNDRQTAIEEAGDCPSGRLVIYDKKTGKPIEPKFKKSIGLVEDLPAGKMGPLWVKGGIPIQSAKGRQYEVRNRVTLCRCGKSQNKPFCDGSHLG